MSFMLSGFSGRNVQAEQEELKAARAMFADARAKLAEHDKTKANATKLAAPITLTTQKEGRKAVNPESETTSTDAAAPTPTNHKD